MQPYNIILNYWIKKIKIDGVAMLVAEPTPANSTTDTDTHSLGKAS